jgi:ATP-dependent Clp protease adaptor protein ClpS
MTKGISVPETSLAQKKDQLPPYRVILHNDDVNTFEYVVRSVRKLTPLKQLDAVRCTLEAHESGSAQLLVTHRERAELYVEQFASRALTVSCEPA